jgi:hypothetical protein
MHRNGLRHEFHQETHRPCQQNSEGNHIQRFNSIFRPFLSDAIPLENFCNFSIIALSIMVNPPLLHRYIKYFSIPTTSRATLDSLKSNEIGVSRFQGVHRQYVVSDVLKMSAFQSDYIKLATFLLRCTTFHRSWCSLLLCGRHTR